jgi:predicted permease
MSFVLSVLPLVLMIALGYGLAKSGALPKAEWKGIETLSFRVLIPAVLVLTITATDFSLGEFGGVMLAFLTVWAVLSILAFSLRFLPADTLNNSAFTSMYQLGTRWNAFFALAAAEQFTGAAGLGVLAVGIALLIPVINVSCILILTGFGPEKRSPLQVLSTLIRNPLVQACFIGLALAFGDVTLPQPVFEALDMVGRGALALGLMAVGAGISLRRLARWDWKVGAGLLLRPVLAPFLFFGAAYLVGLNPVQTFAGILVFAAPAASNGYIIAKQMGGDADLYADTLTWQTIASLVALPLWAYWLLG